MLKQGNKTWTKETELNQQYTSFFGMSRQKKKNGRYRSFLRA